MYEVTDPEGSLKGHCYFDPYIRNQFDQDFDHDLLYSCRCMNSFFFSVRDIDDLIE